MEGRRKFAGAVLIAALTVGATFAEYTGNCLTISASNGKSTASKSWSTDSMSWNSEKGQWEWALKSSYDLRDDAGTLLGTLDKAQVEVKGDPQIFLSFAVSAGGSDTVFTITSGLLSFATINSPEGQAGAAFTITDNNNNGSTLTPNNPSGSAYTAQYNGQAPGGTIFADLVNAAFSSDPGKSNSVSENFPGIGYSSIGTPVSDMSSQVSFTLTAKDSASGTNNYEIVPEPATLVLLALAGMGLIRRR